MLKQFLARHNRILYSTCSSKKNNQIKSWTDKVKKYWFIKKKIIITIGYD